MNRSAEPIRDQLVALLPRLRRFARAISRNTPDADDLVQVAVERALSQLDELPDADGLENWMFGIVRRASLEESPSSRQRDLPLAPAEVREPVADSSSEAPIQRLSVEEALERLPEEQRLTLALVLIEGMAYKEAAAVLEVPVDTVMSRLARGREALEVLLGGRAGGV